MTSLSLRRRKPRNAKILSGGRSSLFSQSRTEVKHKQRGESIRSTSGLQTVARLCDRGGKVLESFHTSIFNNDSVRTCQVGLKQGKETQSTVRYTFYSQQGPSSTDNSLLPTFWKVGQKTLTSKLAHNHIKFSVQIKMASFINHQRYLTDRKW